MDNGSKEARRLDRVSNNEFSRREHRSAASDGGGLVELPETVRGRYRMEKKDRDRDRDSMVSRSKRWKSSHSMHREEDSTEESVGNEQEYDDSGVSRRLSPHTATSISELNHRRIVQPARHSRQPQPPPPWKGADETIGFPVPRKARSASGKRSHENWISAGGNGVGNDLHPSNSPAGISLETVSPSSSNVSVRKKVKTIGSKIQLSQTGKSPSTTQEDIEIEIAGLLCDLMASKKNDSPLNSKPNDIDDDSKKEVAEIACSLAYSPSTNCDSSSVRQITRASCDPSSDNAVRNNHIEGVGSPLTLTLQNSTDHEGRVQHAKQEVPSRESANFSECPSMIRKLDCVHENSDSDAGANRNLVLEKEKSPSNDGDRQEIQAQSSVSQTKCKQGDKFEIDLMAPPPMTLSRELDGQLLGDLTSESKPMKEDLINVGDKMERQVKNEVIVERVNDVDTSKGKREFLKLDLKSNQEESSTLIGDMKGANWRKEQHKASFSDALKKTAQFTLAPSPVTAAGLPNGLPTLGYMPRPFLTFAPVEIIGSSISPALQPPGFSFSQPRPKRCAAHQFIARNIALHQQQVGKTNQSCPDAAAAAAAVNSASVPGAERKMLQGLPPAQSVDSGRQLQRTLMGMNLDPGLAPQTPGLAANKTLGSSNTVDSNQRKQLMIEQNSQPTSTGGLMRGPAFLYPPSQHQATAANQQGPANSTASASKPENSTAGSLAASPAMSAMATVDFGYPNWGNDQAPYVAMIHKNGFPFSFQSPVETVPAFKGESSAQTMPVMNEPFSSQMFHPSQLPQQQTRMQTLFQPANHAISMSSKASSSRKQQQGTPVTGTKMLTPTSLQHQQPQLHASLTHKSRKAEGEISGENTPPLVGRAPYFQNGFHEESFAVQAQPLNFSLKASAPSGSNALGNYSDNHQSQQQQRQHSQQKTHKGGVELMPSQPFGISFASFNGAAGGAPSSLNFSSTAQGPVIFQSLPDVTPMGYYVAGVSPSAQQRNHLASEGKIAIRSTQTEDEKKSLPVKLTNPGPTTLVFDNSSRTLSFIPSSVVGSWPSHSITSTTLTTNAPLATNASCSQQPHALQHQKQHVIQQQQHAMPGRGKTSTVNTSSAGTGFSNNPLVFTQTQLQRNISVPSSQGRSSGRASDSQIHHPSLVASTTASPIQTSFVQQGRLLPGRTQISFGANSHLEEVLPAQMSQVVSNHQPSTSSAEFYNSRSNPQSSKSGQLQMQQMESPSAGTGQKSSPVCGRNLPSILSTCPSHLSELKY